MIPPPTLAEQRAAGLETWMSAAIRAALAMPRTTAMPKDMPMKRVHRKKAT